MSSLDDPAAPEKAFTMWLRTSHTSPWLMVIASKGKRGSATAA